MEILEQIRNITNEENIYIDEPMRNHTTFRTGGNADILVIPESEKEIIELIKLDFKKYIIGNGSNILVKDGGIRGLVIKLSKNNNYTVNGNIIVAESGINIGKLSQIAMENELSGLEFACGIPGTLGGAIMMNAGAYGGQMSDIIAKTKYVDYNGNVGIVEDHEFGYRKSYFTNKECLILSSEIKLNKGNKEEIKEIMNKNMVARNEKQPINFPSAGSTFKRPEGYFAGKLIEDSGLKGYRIGGAEVSTLHAGFVINKENATSKDILDLIKHIQNTVKEKFNVDLETEIRIIGEDIK